MKYGPLGSTGLTISRLGFGCAQLMGRTGRHGSLRALAVALDQGITYFDTAPSYGYGEAEGLLGHFLSGRRDRLVIATKFGIEARPQGRVKRLAKTVARPIFRLIPSLRRGMRRRLGAEFIPGRFDLAEMHQSVERSLRGLRTDRIDVLLVHGCPAGIHQRDDLFEAMAALVAAGKIRAYGLATEVDAILAGRRAIGVAQFPYSVLDQRGERLWTEADRAASGRIAFQPFGGDAMAGELGRRLRSVRLSRDLSPTLRAKLDPDDPRLVADLALNAVLTAGGIDAVLCSMMSVKHIRDNAGAVERSRFDADDLATLRGLFARGFEVAG